MKKIILILCIALAHFSLKAQLTEEAVFTHYNLNPSLINPGAYGFNGGSQAFMNIRSGWTGFPGSPKTYALSYNGAIGDVMGVGASILSENVAALTNLRVQGGLSARFQISDDFTIAGGLTGEVSQRSISDAILQDDFYDQGDAIVEGNIDASRFFDASFGVFGQYGNTYAGVSLPNLVVAKLSDIKIASDSTENKLSFLKSYAATLGHEFVINDDLQIEPSVFFIKIENAPIRADINILAKFLEEKFTAGLSYRYMEATFDDTMGGHAGVLLGFKVAAFSLYYSYDVSFLKFQEYNGGGHEVTIGFDFKNNNGNSRVSNF